MLRAGEDGTDFSHALCPAPDAGALGALVPFRPEVLAFSVLHALKHTAWTGGAARSQVPGRVFTMNDTSHLRLRDDPFLALA